jgi:hypothetical protein
MKTSKRRMKKCSRPLVTVDGLIVAFSETTKVSQDVKCNIQDKDEDSWLAAIQDGDLKAFLRDRYFRFSDAFKIKNTEEVSAQHQASYLCL